jgi:NAD(P)-dependent dehydrogenase (short-subunit alcohol dehydrogenase family)
MIRSVATAKSLRALVTGGTSGIGATIVERLRAEGASIVFTGREPARGMEVERLGLVERNYPRHFLGQLLAPFRSRPVASDDAP